MSVPSQRALRFVGAAVTVATMAVACVQSPGPSASPTAASPTLAATPTSAPVAAQSQPAIQPASLGNAGSAVASPTASADVTALDLENAVSAIYTQVSPSVVQIVVQGVSQSTRFGQIPQSGEGSGIVLDDQGRILTNYHVISGAQSIDVALADGTTASATLLGSDPGSDLAVIEVDPSKLSASAGGLEPATLGDSDQVKVGQIAIAIGNPFGLDDSLSFGFISGVNRTRDEGSGSRPVRGMIQTDAPINPGNSGGALVNSRGEVIGITSSIESPVDGSVGIGFALPINLAKDELQRMIAGETIDHPYLGITGVELNSTIAQQLGLSISEGVYVVHVVSGSPAEKAGLQGAVSTATTQPRSPRSQLTPTPGTQPSGSLAKGGDVITAVDGQKVTKSEDISSYLDTKQVGDSVTLTIVRDGQTRTATATLAAWPTQ